MEEESQTKLRTPLLPKSYPSHFHLSSFILAKHYHAFSAQYTNTIAILAAPLLALLLILFLHINDANLAVPMLAVMFWVFAWWSTNAVPMAIASLVPLFAMPLLRIREAEEVAKSYANDTTFLIMASFVMAAAIQKHGLHRRIILHTILSVGPHPRWLLLAFMCFATVVSMLIDNTPAVAMITLLGVALLEDLLITSQAQAGHLLVLDYGKALIFGIAYSLSMGGMATLTGNGANLVLPAMWQTLFPTAEPIGYVQWFLFGFPVAVAIVLFTWLILCYCFCPASALSPLSTSLRNMPLQEKIDSLGPMPFAEKSVLAILLVYIVVLITKSKVGAYPGWDNLFTGYIGIGTITVLMAIILFVVPDGKEPGKMLLDWESCSNISWSTILLLGGGFALADGFQSSGLKDIVAENLQCLKRASYILMTLTIAVMTGIITKFTSNTTVVSLFLPIMTELALASHKHPLWLMVPTVICSQFSFMLRVATAPNDIAYGTGYISIKEMAMLGISIMVFAVLLLSLLMPTLGTLILIARSEDCGISTFMQSNEMAKLVRP